MEDNKSPQKPNASKDEHSASIVQDEDQANKKILSKSFEKLDNEFAEKPENENLHDISDTSKDDVEVKNQNLN